MRIALLTNPKSRENKKNPLRRKKLEDIVGKNNIYDISQKEQLYSSLSHIDYLCIDGGDGTFHRTVTDILNAGYHLPVLIPLRGGTWNVTPKSVLVTEDNPQSCLAKFVTACEKGGIEEKEKQLLAVDADHERKYGFIFANGVLYKALERYLKSKIDEPHLRLGELFLKANEILKPIRGQVSIDGVQEINGVYSAIAATIHENMSLAFLNVFSDLSGNDFHVLGLKATGTELLGKLLNRIFPLVELPNNDDFIDVNACSVIINSPGSLEYSIDGELYAAQDIELSSGPKIRFAKL